MKVKQQYEAPELIELGAVEDLTQGPGGGFIDSIFGGDGGCRPIRVCLPGGGGGGGSVS